MACESPMPVEDSSVYRRFLVTTAHEASAVVVYDLDTLLQRCQISLPSKVYRCSIKRNSYLVAVACYNNRVYILDVSGREIVLALELDGEGRYNRSGIWQSISAQFDDSGRMLACAGWNQDGYQYITLYNSRFPDPSQWTTVRQIQCHQYTISKLNGNIFFRGTIWSLLFTPSSHEKLLSVSDDGTAVLWNTSTGQQHGKPLSHSTPVYSAVFSSDDSHLVIGGDKVIYVWNMQTQSQIVAPLEGHTGKVFSVVFSNNGRMLATGCSDGILQLWDALTLQPMATVNHKRGALCSLVFNDDDTALWAGYDKALEIVPISCNGALADTGSIVAAPTYTIIDTVHRKPKTLTEARCFGLTIASSSQRKPSNGRTAELVSKLASEVDLIKDLDHFLSNQLSQFSVGTPKLELESASAVDNGDSGNTQELDVEQHCSTECSRPELDGIIMAPAAPSSFDAYDMNRPRACPNPALSSDSPLQFHHHLALQNIALQSLVDQLLAERKQLQQQLFPIQ